MHRDRPPQAILARHISKSSTRPCCQRGVAHLPGQSSRFASDPTAFADPCEASIRFADRAPMMEPKSPWRKKEKSCTQGKVLVATLPATNMGLCKTALFKRKVVFLQGSVHFHVRWWEGTLPPIHMEQTCFNHSNDSVGRPTGRPASQSSWTLMDFWWIWLLPMVSPLEFLAATNRPVPLFVTIILVANMFCFGCLTNPLRK